MSSKSKLVDAPVKSIYVKVLLTFAAAFAIPFVNPTSFHPPGYSAKCSDEFIAFYITSMQYGVVSEKKKCACFGNALDSSNKWVILPHAFLLPVDQPFLFRLQRNKSNKSVSGTGWSKFELMWNLYVRLLSYHMQAIKSLLAPPTNDRCHLRR